MNCWSIRDNVYLGNEILIKQNIAGLYVPVTKWWFAICMQVLLQIVHGHHLS